MTMKIRALLKTKLLINPRKRHNPRRQRHFTNISCKSMEEAGIPWIQASASK